MPASQATSTKKSGKKRPMTAEHRAALSQGKINNSAIRSYLTALEGTSESPSGDLEKLKERMKTLEGALANGTDPLQKVRYAQDLINIRRKVTAIQSVADLQENEEKVIPLLLPYSEKAGVTRAAWKLLKVPDRVLDAAGFPPGRGRRAKEEERESVNA